MQDKAFQDFFLVGIGASAGGLQPLEAFFGSLPLDPGAGFVVVQHLSPDFPSLMVELLQRRTKLPVSVIEDGVVIQPNHVYVLSPGVMVSLKGERLLLEKRQGGVADYPIDHFFLSLSQQRGVRTIGILLSGTGSDGTEGLKAISRNGGIALVQSQETAQFGAMPENPVSSGFVDEIMSPEELAQVVYDIVRYTAAQTTLGINAEPLLPRGQLTQILDILQRQENIDFSQYKSSTVHRRIVHRLLLSQRKTIEQYIDYLTQSPDQVKSLKQDLLIGATRFFLDPDMWSFLKAEVLPSLINDLQPRQPLRLWVPACSTGEEAYSLAIVVDEVMGQMSREHPVKIFATDLDQEALNIASKGMYYQTIHHDVAQERLNTYFVQENSIYRIRKFIRSRVVFASHDVARNPGFSQMHLVSCRNLLIYMQPSLQEQVLKMLHFSLASKGVLILGSSEHLGSVAHGFHTLESQWKVFRKRGEVQFPVSPLVHSPTLQTVSAIRSTKKAKFHYDHFISSVLQLRFGDVQTTCLLVNEGYLIVHIFLNSAKLLEFPLGEINTNVLDLITPALKVPLRTALHRARRQKKAVLYSDIRISKEEVYQRVNLWVGPALDKTASPQPLLIVLLEVLPEVEATPCLSSADFDANADLTQQLHELEFELQQTRENLQTSIKELETVNEEQQATNEELLAANEELQTTNEEMQSVNEELYTVNAENEERIQQLIQLSTDIDNLLRSTDIGVVFLDQDLNIRKFTPAAAEVFNFRTGDLGRPLTELVNSLDIDNLTDLIQQVAQTEISQETEANNWRTGDRFLLRILPYRKEKGDIDGVVLTLIDMNDLKQVQEALLQSNQVLEDIYRNSPFGLSLLDQNLRFLRINQALADIDGVSIEKHLGQPIQALLPDLYEKISSYLQQVLTERRLVTVELSGMIPAEPEVERTWLAYYYPVQLSVDRVGVGAIVSDITKQKQIQTDLHSSRTLLQNITMDITRIKEQEAQLQQLTRRLEQIQHIAHLGDWQYDLDQNRMTWSRELFRITGIDPAAGIPSIPELLAMVHPQDRSSLTNLLNQDPVQNTLDVDIRLYPKDSERSRYLRIFSRGCYNKGNGVRQLQGMVMDITERKLAETNLQRQAFFDPLTQLPNRAFFLQHLKFSIVRVNRDTSQQFAVLYLDLDGFKEINDTLGHATGDQLLIEIAQRLEKVIRPGDIVCRLGGDEFAILLEKTAHPEVALNVAHRIQALIPQPVQLTAANVTVSTSIGIAFYEPDAPWQSDTAVLENSDIAMYHAKRQGPDNIALFQPAMRDQRVDRIELKTDIVRAIEQEEFVLYYQPLLDLQNYILCGFETLVRWYHPQGGLLLPLEFLPIAHETCLMPGLEPWILKSACAQLAHWHQQFQLPLDFCLNINVSPDFLKHESFLNNLRSALGESGVNPANICLEVTENSFIGASRNLDTLLARIKDLGVQIALDDFGTGYSSLSYLHRLPIDVIKIDQSFVQALDLDTSLMGITKAIVNLAHQLELNVIAEGVETSPQLLAIQGLSCQYGQGYFFSHAVSPQAAENFLRDPNLLSYLIQARQGDSR